MQTTSVSTVSPDNFGVTRVCYQGNPALVRLRRSALWGTSSLVSVEALQEFRVSYFLVCPGFGRSLEDKWSSPRVRARTIFTAGRTNISGMTYSTRTIGLRMPPGSPVRLSVTTISALSAEDQSGKTKTFFFLSYEGARLRLPQTSVFDVPSTSIRTSAPTSVAPVLSAFPMPNGPVSPDGFTAQFTALFPIARHWMPGAFASITNLGDRISVFGRYQRRAVRKHQPGFWAVHTADNYRKHQDANRRHEHDVQQYTREFLRFNYSTQDASATDTLDSFAGSSAAEPKSFSRGFSRQPEPSRIPNGVTPNFLAVGPLRQDRTRQFNVADDLDKTFWQSRLEVWRRLSRFVS